MHNGLVRALWRFKWRVAVPALYHLGLPHERIADALRIAPIKAWLGGRPSAGKETAQSVVSTGKTASNPETRFPGPDRSSIYAASSVAATVRVLRDELGWEAADRYVSALIDREPWYEPDVRWGRFLAKLDEAPVEELEEGETLLKRFPLKRLRNSLYQNYNQVGNISRSLELLRAIDADNGSESRTTQILAARQRMLQQGVVPPAPVVDRAYRPVDKRAFYLLHNSLPYDSGGYATRTHGLVCGMQAQGWDVECVTRLGYPSDVTSDRPWVAPVDTVDGVSYYRLRDQSHSYRRLDAEQYMLQNAESVLKLAKKRRPGLIHGASNHINGIAAGYVGRRLGLPSIFEVRGLWELTRISRQPEFEGSELYNMIVRLETQACLETDAVITLTQGLKGLMVERGVPGEKITVLPNGVDTRRFQPRERDQDLADELGARNRVVLGYVGSMPQYEGLDDLLHAMALLPESQRRELFLLLVGDGDQYNELLALRDRLGLGDCVDFTGRVPFERVDRLYSIVDVAVFPRKPQPVTELVSPMKPFEAMAMEKPVLASNVAALAEIVQDGKTGLLFEKGSRESLAEAMGRLVDDQALRRRLAANALTWVRENRDWRTLSGEAVRLYERLLADA